jgi:hypothetical protein
MDYFSLVADIFSNDETINNILDKDLELFLDSNPDIKIEDTKINSYKTSDELDNVNLILSTGYKIAKINRYENPKLSTIIFLKIKK